MAYIILPAGSTSTDLQSTIDAASFGDIIQLSGDMPFSGTVTVRNLLEVTIRSAANDHWVLYQFGPGKRHFSVDGSLILENVTVDGRGGSGGIVLNQGAFCLQHGAVVQNCRADNGGGVEVVRGVFSIYEGDAGAGLPLKGGVVRANEATNGGGIYLNAGLFNLSASTGLVGNNLADHGGGVYVGGGTFRLTGGALGGNEAFAGGGLYLAAGALSMTRGRIHDNRTVASGGGIYLTADATLSITGTAASITHNSSLNGNGGGIYTEDITYGNLTVSPVLYGCNRAAVAYAPPPNVLVLYPNLQHAQTTLQKHSLNNYDINYFGTEPLRVNRNITYHADDKKGRYDAPEVGPCETDVVRTAQETGLAREGSVLFGWNTKPDGTGTTYHPGDTLALAQDLALYAIWLPSSAPLCDACYKRCHTLCSQ